LDFARVLYRINFYLGHGNSSQFGIKLRSDFIKLLEQAYHQERYKEAIKLGYEAIKECSDDASAFNFLIKALIQEEIWDKALKLIDKLYPIDEYRNIYYLKGFYHRKKGEIQFAIDAYNEAKKYGKGGMGVNRELAHCYIMIDELELARNHIEKALSIQSDNSHIIDMAAKLEIKLGNQPQAKKYIDQLELIDNPKHYHMRASSFSLKFGYLENALFHAKQSIRFGGKMFFSGRVQHVKAMIAKGMFPAAKDEMRLIDNDFHNKKNDVKIALKCSLAAAEGDNSTGLKLVDKFSSYSSKQAIGFKKKFLRLLSDDMTVKYRLRKEYKAELDRLKDFDEAELTDIDN